MIINNRFTKGLAVIITTSLLLTITACSHNGEQTEDDCEQVAGTWIIQEVSDNSQCGSPEITEHKRYTVTQDHCQLSIVENDLQGVISGSTIYWPASSFLQNGGTTKLAKIITNIKENKLSSTADWSWSNGLESCTGTTKMTGYIAEKGNTVDADFKKLSAKKWTGTWANAKTESVEFVEINKQNVLFNYYWAADPDSGRSAGSTLIKGERQASEVLAFTWNINGDEKLSFSLNKALDKLTAIYENGAIYASNEMTQGETAKSSSQYDRLLTPSDGAFEHIFSLQAPDAKEVYLAGEMTDWQGNVLKMKKTTEGVWILPLYLQQGAWQYKFVIDGQWTYDKANPNTTDDGFEGLNSIIILGEQAPDSQVTENIPHGSIDKITIQSKILGKKSPFVVYLPPGYAKKPKEEYPVLFLLHGYGNNEKQWIRDGKIQNFMDNYLNSGWIKPFIIVMPFADTSMYVGKYETHIINEVISYVDSHYRVKKVKNATAISGMSMGGFGAFYLAHRHQDIFGLSVPLSGFLDMKFYPEFGINGKITMDSKLHFYCGKDDHISFASNEKLRKKLQDNGVDFTYKTADGGHTWRYWNSITKEVLKVVSDYFYP